MSLNVGGMFKILLKMSWLILIKGNLPLKWHNFKTPKALVNKTECLIFQVLLTRANHNM